jgi:hypothetical protein
MVIQFLSTYMPFYSPTGFTGRDFRINPRPSVRLSVRLYVRPSVHKTGFRENAKSTENIFMKLHIWLDCSLEIMHVFCFSSYV